MKHRISPATAISCVALFFSLAGAGMAASRYLITSVRQIAPSVRQQLGSGAQVQTREVLVQVPAAAPGQPSDATAMCPAGFVVVGGGYQSGGGNVYVPTDRPMNGDSWAVEAFGATGFVRAWVECLQTRQ